MRTLYLHIGRSKTGTSSLQRFFKENHDVLKEQYNITYPLASMGKQSKSHKDLAVAFSNNNAAKIKEFMDELSGVRGDVLISSEYLYLKPEICSLFEGFDIKVITFLRRQDYLLNSAFNQAVKVSRRNVTIEEFYRERMKNFDYWFVLSQWEEFVGKDNIFVKPFENTQMPDGIHKEFIKVIGKEWSDSFAISKNKINKSLNRASLYILQKASQVELKNPGMFTTRLLEAIEDCGFHESKTKSTMALSPVFRKKILNDFLESNKKVAKYYLGREDGRLFYNNENFDEQWCQDASLNSDEMIKLLIVFWNQMRNQLASK